MYWIECVLLDLDLGEIDSHSHPRNTYLMFLILLGRTREQMGREQHWTTGCAPKADLRCAAGHAPVPSVEMRLKLPVLSAFVGGMAESGERHYLLLHQAAKCLLPKPTLPFRIPSVVYYMPS